jgi:hypothetical protein
MGGKLRAYILTGKPERKRPLGRPNCRWENNIKNYLREIECEGVDWISLVQDSDRWRALENTVINRSGAIKGDELIV